MWSVLKKYSVDGRIAMWQSAGNHLDGIFLDNLSYIFANKENYRRSLWAYSNVPLTFSYTTRKVMQYNGIRALRSSVSRCGAIWPAREWG